MLMSGNFKEYTTYKQRVLNIINEKKELFVITLKGCIPEERRKTFINYAFIIRNIEIANGKSKKKQTKLTQLITAMSKFIPFGSYYFWYIIDSFGFFIEDLTKISIFYVN
jgi:uncharacterized FlgJ-related protein